MQGKYRRIKASSMHIYIYIYIYIYFVGVGGISNEYNYSSCKKKYSSWKATNKLSIRTPKCSFCVKTSQHANLNRILQQPDSSKPLKIWWNLLSSHKFLFLLLLTPPPHTHTPKITSQNNVFRIKWNKARWKRLIVWFSSTNTSRGRSQNSVINTALPYQHIPHYSHGRI